MAFGVGQRYRGRRLRQLRVTREPGNPLVEAAVAEQGLSEPVVSVGVAAVLASVSRHGTDTTTPPIGRARLLGRRSDPAVRPASASQRQYLARRQGGQGFGYGPVPVLGRVLVPERGARVGVAAAAHQLCD